MTRLFLEDLKGLSETEVQAHLVSSYEAPQEDVLKYDVLIAYESVGSWGCDSASFFLLRNKDNGVLYEVHGSHCSCNGFEGQFEPEETTIEHLRSDKFYFYTGGYDDNSDANKEAFVNYVQNLDL